MTFSGPPLRSSNFLRVSRWQPKILAASEREINLRSGVIAFGLLGPRVVDLRLVLMACIQAHSYRTPLSERSSRLLMNLDHSQGPSWTVVLRDRTPSHCSSGRHRSCGHDRY